MSRGSKGDYAYKGVPWMLMSAPDAVRKEFLRRKAELEQQGLFEPDAWAQALREAQASTWHREPA
jgi:hypothetical protein